MRLTDVVVTVVVLLGSVASGRADASGTQPVAAPTFAGSPETEAAPASPTKPGAALPPALAQQGYVPSRQSPEPTWVPPYPGAAPASFLSAAQFADYGEWRLQQLSARERALSVLGRPPGYRARRAGGFVMLGAGAGISVLLGLFELLAVSADTGDRPSARAQYGIFVGAVGGLGIAIGGIALLVTSRYDNPYQQEIADLHRERGAWKRDVKRARQHDRGLRFSFDPTTLAVRF